MIDSLSTQTLKRMEHVYVLDKYRALYCYIPKAGCTSWKRVLLTLNGNLNTTMDASQREVHLLALRHLPTLPSFSLEEAKTRLRNFTKFVFVRDPFSRTLSAFRDKFEVNSNRSTGIKNAYTALLRHRKRVSAYLRENKGLNQHVLSPPFRYNTTNITFGDFVDYLGDPWNSLDLSAEEHWREMFRLCLPCDIPYDFVGHLETLKQDSETILKKIGATDLVKFPASTNPTHSSDISIMKQYYDKLSQKQLDTLYKRLAVDVKLFNYPIPEIVRNRINVTDADNFYE